MPELDRNALARQLRQHLESLQAAGVEYAPSRASGGRQPPEGEERVERSPTPPMERITDTSPSLRGLTPPARPETPPADLAAVDSSLFTDTSQLAAVASGLTLEQRGTELKLLAEQVAACKACADLVACRKRTVFGVGPTDPALCFIGEGPGQDEDRTGEPFVGAAGQLLNRIIAACGMQRSEVYICNIVKCRPPGNRTPLPNEAANCRAFLDRQLELIRPKYICCLGACAAQNLLGTTTAIGRLRGNFQSYRGITVMCTYHPSYLLRVPEANRSEAKRAVWEDMKKLLVRMGRPVPGN